MTYPQQLPEKPEGWTRSLVCHFNYGERCPQCGHQFPHHYAGCRITRIRAMEKEND